MHPENLNKINMYFKRDENVNENSQTKLYLEIILTTYHNFMYLSSRVSSIKLDLAKFVFQGQKRIFEIDI